MDAIRVDFKPFFDDDAREFREYGFVEPLYENTVDSG
jgi:hypothetical protein